MPQWCVKLSTNGNVRTYTFQWERIGGHWCTVCVLMAHFIYELVDSLQEQRY